MNHEEPSAAQDLSPIPQDGSAQAPLDEPEPSVRERRSRRRAGESASSAEGAASLGRILGQLALLTVILGLGFVVMLAVLETRPQFAGWGLAPPHRSHEQDAPSLAVRTAGRPAHEVRWLDLDEASVELDLTALQDYRGLQVTRYLEGTVLARMSYTNRSEEGEHLVWQLPLPEAYPTEFEAAQASLKVTGLDGGEVLTTRGAWIATGFLPSGATFAVELAHPLPPTSDLAWHGNRGAAAQRASLRIEGEEVPLRLRGAAPGSPSGPMSAHEWTGRTPAGVGLGFFLLPGHSVFDALKRLLQIAPIVAGMFLVTLLSILAARRTPRHGELLLLALAYAYYFPLVVYLNANLPMKWAVPIAFVASAVVVLNYLRFLIGGRSGVLLGLGLLVAFQLVPTMMAFAQWDRGLVLLTLGSISLLALVSLQTRRLKESMGRGAVALAALIPLPLQDGEIRVSLPAELLPPAAVTPQELPKPAPGELLVGVAAYVLDWTEEWVAVEALLPVESTGASPRPTRLMGSGVFLESVTAPEFLRFSISGTGLDLHLLDAGKGEVRVLYRVPARRDGAASEVQVPTFLTTVGTGLLQSTKSGLVFPENPVWSRSVEAEGITWTFGVGSQPIWITWRDLGRPEPGQAGESDPAPESGDGSDAAASEAAGASGVEGGTEPAAELPPLKPVYEIAARESHHLTLIEADGRLLHFTELVFDAGAVGDLCRLTLPPGMSVSSVTLDDREVEGVVRTDSTLAFPFTQSARTQTLRKVTLALTRPAVELAFRGSLSLELPRYEGTEAQLHWEVRGPTGFELAARGTGMQQDTGPGGTRFGSYSSTAAGRPSVRLRDSLVPAGRTAVRFVYAQQLDGVGLPLPR